MLLIKLPSLILAAGCLVLPPMLLQASAELPASFALKSTRVDLPDSNSSFPAGPNVETVANNCQTCHSPAMILNQPALSKATWDAEVHKMITVFKAPVADGDIAAIVDYLVAVKGAPAPKPAEPKSGG